MRIIFHIDVNNAFLSWSAVYLLQNGSDIDIREIPAIIAGDEKKRHGIVLAKSPIAKKYGIVTAETIGMAKKKCSNLQVFSPNFAFYEECSNKMFHYLEKYTDRIERFSIDECFLDLSDTKYLYDDILKLAYFIKDDIKNNFGFTVNIGIANNKLCAKMASDFLKPDHVHTLFDNEIKDKMWPLSIEDLLYIGKSSSNVLKSIGINTIGDLANTSEEFLKKYFKNRTIDMINSARGIDNSPVISYRGKNKCFSNSITLPRDTSDLKTIHKVLLDLSDNVGIRARKDNLYAKTIAITLKTKSFRIFSHQKKFINPINKTMDIYNNVLKVLDEIKIDEDIRNIGIRLSDLESISNEQISLFDKKDNNDNIQSVLDNINTKYNSAIIMPAIFMTNSDK